MRRLAARRSRAAHLAFVWRWARESTVRRDNCRAARRRWRCRAAQGAGWATRSIWSSPWAMTAHSRPMPRSMPQRAAGSAGVRGWWATIAWTDTTSRPPCSASVIDRTLARPLATSRSSRRVFSLERSLPITGRTRWRRSGSRRIAPVVKRTRPRSRAAGLEAGEPHWPAGAAARPDVRPVTKRRHQVGDAGGVGLLGGAPPPGCDLVLGLVPRPAELVEVPGQQRDSRVRGAGVEVGLDQAQRPVVGEPAAAEALRDPSGLLGGGRLDLEAEAAGNPAVGDGEPLAGAHQRCLPRVSVSEGTA